MRGPIPPLPDTPSWRGTQLKHKDNFIFIFIPLITPNVTVLYV